MDDTTQIAYCDRTEGEANQFQFLFCFSQGRLFDCYYIQINSWVKQIDAASSILHNEGFFFSVSLTRFTGAAYPSLGRFGTPSFLRNVAEGSPVCGRPLSA